MMLSKSNDEALFENREAIFAANRPVLCVEFRLDNETKNKVNLYF